MITCKNINSTFKDKKHFTIGIEPRIDTDKMAARWNTNRSKNKLKLALVQQEFTKGKITLIQHNRIYVLGFVDI